MKYAVQLTWNGNPVLTGECSGAMAYVVLSDIRDSFSGSKTAAARADMPVLRELVEAPLGTVFTGELSDETGRATYRAEVIKE